MAQTQRRVTASFAAELTVLLAAVLAGSIETVAVSALSVLAHSNMDGTAKDPGRVMLNFETSKVKQEFERIAALGGAVIAAPYEMGGGWIATLADPDGNYFQLISPIG